MIQDHIKVALIGLEQKIIWKAEHPPNNSLKRKNRKEKIKYDNGKTFQWDGSSFGHKPK